MSGQADKSSFVSHLCFIPHFPITRLLILAIGLAPGLSSHVSFAQQGSPPRYTESINIIRLRQDWLYQQRTLLHKRLPLGSVIKPTEQCQKGKPRARCQTKGTGKLVLSADSSSAAGSIPITAALTAGKDRIVIRNGHRATTYGRLPISFEANHGQAGPRVKFVARVPGYTIFLTGNGAMFSLKVKGRQKSDDRSPKDLAQPPADVPRPGSASNRGPRTNGTAHVTRHSSPASCLLHVKLEGASPNASVAGLKELPGKANYYIGNNPKKWHIDIPTYARVRYRNVYPGINLVYYGNQQRLEYNFVVSPGADPNQIIFDFKTTGGASQTLHKPERAVAPRITPNGDLLIQTQAGKVRFHAPRVYQATAGGTEALASHQSTPTGRKYVKARYVLGPKDEIGFKISSYDRTRPLVIDPVLTYATYVIGGSNGTAAAGIGVDESGNAYVLGTGNPGSSDQSVVVLALNPQGSSFLYTTYLGGQSSTAPGGIAVDSQGDAYIDGTAGAAFPTTAGAYQSTCSGICNRPFAAELSPSGSLEYSTYLGPSNAAASAIAIDQSGDAYITGTIASDDLPVVNAFQPLYAGSTCTNCSNAFVQKLNPTGSQLLYSTYFGSLSPNGLQPAANGTGIAVDSSGSAYVVGNGSVPLKNPLEQGVGSMFLAKFTPDGTGLVYSTQLGGSGNLVSGEVQVDTATAVAVDSAGNAYATGDAVSPDFPTTMKAYKASCLESGGACSLPQVFVLKVDPNGSSLVYSTLLGAGKAGDVVVDSNGNALVTGTTTSNYFPSIQAVESNLQQNAFPQSNTDAFLTRLNSSGIPDFSTFLGGAFSDDSGAGVAIDSSGDAYVTGSTEVGNDTPVDFPIVNPAPGTQQKALSYTPPFLFAAKINPSAAGPAFSLSPRYPSILELRDVSSSPLTITSITPSSELALEGGTCGSSLPAGDGCTLIVYPVDPQNFVSGTLTISSNASDSPQKFTITQSEIGTNQIFVSANNLRFPAQLVGTLSATQTVTLTNLDYPSMLTISSIQIPTPGVFTQTNDCPATLPAGLSCHINVQYQPVAGSGPEYGQLNINTSQLDFMVNLNGIRSSSSLAASAQSVQFGIQYAGATPLPRVITLTDTGVQPVTAGGFSVTGPFTQTNNCSAPLSPHTSCRVAVSFVPTSNTNATGQLTVNFGSTGSPVTVNLAATGEIQSDLEVSPFQLGFGDVVLGESNTRTLTLSNVSNSTVTISAFNLSSDYTQTNNCNGSLASKTTCTVNVTFTPTAVAEQDGTLAIDFSGTGSPQVIPLSGAGVTPLQVAPTSLAFGQQALGTTSASQNVELSNQGTSPVTINSINVSSGFQLASNSCPNSIQQFYTCQLQIAFAPTATGAVTGTLTIDASDSSNPHTVALSGTGAVVPEVVLNPTSLTFTPIVDSSTSSPQTLTLHNTGDATLTIASLVADGDFAQTNTCDNSVPVGASCTISVTFSPTAAGLRTGIVTIGDNAPDSPQTVGLTGTGEDFELGAVSGSSPSETVSAGSAANYSLTVTPEGGFNSAVSLACSGTPSLATCTVTPSSVTLDGTDAQNVKVTVTTTAPGLVPPGPSDGPPPSGGIAMHDWWIALLMLMAWIALAFKRRRRVPLLAGAVLLAAIGLSCGGGGSAGGSGGGSNTKSSPGTAAGTYTLTVTGASGSLTHSTNMTLTVQ